MTYTVSLTDDAIEDLRLLKRHEPSAYRKFLKLYEELQEHPFTGTGHPEPLKGDRYGQWSRRISAKHRLVYKVQEHTISVLLLSAYKHYDDK